MTSAYIESQQVSLQAELDRIYVALACHAGLDHAQTQIRPDLVEAEPCPSRLNPRFEYMVQTFGLSPFEGDVLLLCTGFELENRFAKICADIHLNSEQTSPTFGLAFSALPSAHWSALSPDGPLRRWRLLHVDMLSGLLRSPLRIDERILHYLMGTACTDDRLKPFIRCLPSSTGYSFDSYSELAHQGSSLWKLTSNQSQPQRPKWLLLIGRSAGDQQGLMRKICDLAGFEVRILNASDIPASPAERDSLASAWTREALLTGAALYLRTADTDGVDAPKLITSFLGLVSTPIAVEVREGSALEQLNGTRIYIPVMGHEERRALWIDSLGPLAHHMNGSFDRILDSFALDSSGIRTAGAMAREVAALSVGSRPLQDLTALAWNVCRNQARRSLDSLAHRIEPRAKWDSLILPEVQLQTLQQIVIHVRRRHVVQTDWGFSEKYARGSGVTALFSGPSGTGKTMAAEVIANELALDLYHIDLASTLSKYIGETEKHLRRIFDAADESGAVLLFDEADALFGKRSEVTDSHDRYANLQISYLLQRMESYRGIAILTTNMKQALDTAFLRRLRFIVQFPFPDASQRERIWQRVFPTRTPVAALDYKRLAQLNIPGGIIRNIATYSAFLAAEEGRAVHMDHILRASRMEYAKIDKPLTATETGGWL